MDLQKQWQEWATSAMEFPETIQFEVTNRCNANCIMCPVPHSKRKREDLPMDLFKKGIDECVPYKHKVTQIMLHQNGEPLLVGAEKLVTMSNYAYEKLGKLQHLGIFTNGSLLDKDAADRIIDSSINFVTVSFDGGTKEDYEKVRRGLKFEEVRDNIYYFAERKVAKKRDDLYLQVLMLPQKSNASSFVTFRQLFVRQGINSIGGGGICNYAGLVDISDKLLDTQFYRGDKYAPCWRLWTFLIIGSNGKPLLCCNDVEQPYELGDLRTMTMKEIWNNDGFRMARINHLNRWQKNMLLCDDCDWMQTFQSPEWWYKEGYDRIV